MTTPPNDSQRLAQQQRPGGFPVMKQRWAELGFFHWPFDPEIIAARLPKGLHVDTFDGRAWMGVVPFLMQRIRPVYLPPVPWLSWFHELNLRTYVFDENGNPGVWFFSLECNQPLAVEIARRTFNLPYQHACMKSEIDSNCVIFKSSRKDNSTAESIFKYPHPHEPIPAEPGSLEWFLVERYSLFSTSKSGTLYSGRVHHTPYQIEPMASGSCSTTIFALNGFEEPSSPPTSMLSASPVDVTIFPLKSI
ncbi:MAG: YqjF family protein [Akkermansiaceae bacterium]